MSDLSAEDAKLVTLAKSARARVGAAEGAAVRDGDGRSYTGVTVARPTFVITALQLAVANAIAAGATMLEAAVVVTEESKVDETPVSDLTPDAPVLVVVP
ncbi:cytidine deaminase [Allorhizocola rhizosphaerae]|uniref:cytidine deaminase n=1 Tax=Allorhizocola rhizosphaerae TaxID=1872709 RepID=UPI000E3D793E|nr:cytidine deaminase [Allorhizocola rhizosphaerae]